MSSPETPAGLAHQFDSYEQQRSAASLGMWVFIAQEVMFFGGLFLAYAVYRWLYPGGFMAGSRHLDVVLGTVNTAVLLGSSLSMALAVRGVQTGRSKAAAVLLIVTMVLGAIFLGIKFDEYHHKFTERLVPGPLFQATGPDARGMQLFFSLYFAMTGLHALHMIIGILVLAGLVIPTWRGRFTPENFNFVENTGLYWHFVDVVWIFLFPLLYLVGRHG